MGTLVLITKAVEESGYTTTHVRLLLRRGLIKGEKQGGTWLVDLESLREYEAQMNEIGSRKYDPTVDSKFYEH